MLAPPSVGRVVLGWSPDLVAAAALLSAAGLYARGVRVLAGRDRTWPASRSVAFAAGVVVLAVATQSGLGRYDTSLMSAHAVQHVLVGMAAPMLLALGAPMTLALQTTTGRARRACFQLLHGRLAAAMTHPAVAAGLLGVSLFGLYFSPVLRWSLEHEAVHAAVHLHFLAAGCAFFWPVLGVDVGPRRLPHGLRALLVLALVPVHAVLGVAILGTRQLLAGGWYATAAAGWGTDALADQRVAGGLLWVTGDLVGVVAAGVVLAQWIGHDERAALREDRRLDALTATGTELPAPGP